MSFISSGYNNIAWLFITCAEQWIETYKNYFKSMLGIDKGEAHSEIKNLILKLDNLT